MTSAGPFALLTVALLGLAYWWLDPEPPKHVTLATGPDQSAYDEFGHRYAKALAAYGIEVTLVSSEGSSQNLEWLNAGKVDLAFVQGGSSALPVDSEVALVSLGSLFVEPVWLFYRENAAQKVTGNKNGNTTLESLKQLRGLRVNVGTPGSGVPSLMGKLFETNRIDPNAITVSR